MSKHYLVYQITNLINEKIYIGIHITENVADGYMGSGLRIKKAIKKYGVENFKKEIIFDFDNPEEMIAKESELVDRKFINRKDTYNIKLGGKGWLSNDTVPVVDSNGNFFRVHNTDEKYISGELVSIAKGCVPVQDKFGNTFVVKVDDVRLKSGELWGTAKGTVVVSDEKGKSMRVKKDDIRLLNKVVVPTWKGRNHKEDSKKRIGQANSIHQAGRKNSQFGTCWVMNEFESKKVKKTELESYLEQGWVKGRKMK